MNVPHISLKPLILHSLGWYSLLATFFATIKALATASFTQALGCLLLHAGHYSGNVLTKRMCPH
jgi:hypothetical protein